MEILFRGFNPCENGTKTITIDGKEHKGGWTEGYFFKIWHEYYILWGTTNGIPNMLEVLPETVGMWTGLTDKNGKKIFEGDIVRAGFDEPMHNYEVIFYQCGFKLKSKECENCYDYSIHDEKYEMEVIGTKWDNAELLEEK